MPNADFFAHFGLYIAKDFLDTELRTELLSEVRAAPAAPAMVTADGEVGHYVNENTRKTNRAEVSAETVSIVKERMLSLTPTLERHLT